MVVVVDVEVVVVIYDGVDGAFNGVFNHCIKYEGISPLTTLTHHHPGCEQPFKTHRKKF